MDFTICDRKDLGLVLFLRLPELHHVIETWPELQPQRDLSCSPQPENVARMGQFFQAVGFNKFGGEKRGEKRGENSPAQTSMAGGDVDAPERVLIIEVITVHWWALWHYLYHTSAKPGWWRFRCRWWGARQNGGSRCGWSLRWWTWCWSGGCHRYASFFELVVETRWKKSFHRENAFKLRVGILESQCRSITTLE